MQGDKIGALSTLNNQSIVECYDGYNQKAHEEVCMTVRSAMTGAEGNDADPKVAYGINPVESGMMIGTTVPAKECGQTLRKSPGGENGLVQSIAAMCYIVRRLTPTECERLMGLPDGYTIPAGLDANDPALVAEFQRIHDTFGAIMADYEGKKPPKPKTAAQVEKWLAKITNPATCPDSPRYKVCGNGWATNQPRWILCRMLAADGIDPFERSAI